MIEHVIGRHVQQKRSSKRWRLLHCEDCGTDFVYEQTVTGEGKSFNLFHVHARQALIASKQKAEEDLQTKLAGNEHSPVCCPACGAYPAALKEAATNEITQAWTMWLFIAYFAATTLLITGIFLAMYLLPQRTFPFLIVVPFLIAFQMGGLIAVPMASYYFCRPHDINAPTLKARRVASPMASVMPLSTFEAYFNQLPPKERERALHAANPDT